MGVQVLFAALHAAGTSAGFEVKEVSDKTFEQFIDKLDLRKVTTLIAKNNNQYKSLLYQLAILSKHGGIALTP